MKLRPRHNRVLIKVFDADEAKEIMMGTGGLSPVDEDGMEILQVGRVVAVPTNKIDFKLNDIVYYQRLASHRLYFNNEEYRIVHKKYIEGVVI